MRSYKRMSFEVLIGVLALGIMVFVNVSIPHFGGRIEAKSTVRELDPTLLRTASKANPCTKGEVALTFDDGPDDYTGPILEVLRAYGVKATFFVLGAKAIARPDLVRTAIHDGQLVENHSWDHPHLTDLTPAMIEDEIIRTQQALIGIGVPAPIRFRPPYNDQDDKVRAAAAKHGLKLDPWDVDSRDWRGRRAQDIAKAVIAQVHPGAVVLLHDGIQDSLHTLNALPDIIEGIRNRGYCTGTLL